MLKKIFILSLSFSFFSLATADAQDISKEAELALCQDQADNFGNGKGDDKISKKCINTFKEMAMANFSAKEFKTTKLKSYGYRNMILVEKKVGTNNVTEIIAGNSTELKAVRSLALDETHQEVAVLEEGGDVLFFSTRITGNTAPFRVLRHKEIEGASELTIDEERNLVALYNKKSKKILFFSRLANLKGRAGDQKLGVVKVLDMRTMNLKNLRIDSTKSEMNLFDENQKKDVVFDLKEIFAK